MNLENITLKEKVQPETPMKEWMVDYVGSSFKKKLEKQNARTEGEESHEWDGSVTVEMIVETMAKDFPEFLMAVAEENWIRGYHQALNDVREGEKLYRQELEKKEKEDDTEE